MSKLTIESAHEIVEYNIQRIYHLPQKRYEAIHYFLDRGTLRRTLLNILNYIKDKQIIIDKHRYNFILDTDSLTHKVRKKASGRVTSNSHFNLLCCMGLLNKVYQNYERDIVLEVNRRFIEETGSAIPINVFSFRRYTEEELDRIEQRSQRLMQAGVTIGKVTYNYLCINECKDIADEVYFLNNRAAPKKKRREFQAVLPVIKELVEQRGYATREEIQTQVTEITGSELAIVLRTFKAEILKEYDYRPPKKKEMEKWRLPNRKYIYTKRETEEDAERDKQ